MDRPTLISIVNHYLENGDVTTAESYIKTLGPKIEGFDVTSELLELETAYNDGVKYGQSHKNEAKKSDEDSDKPNKETEKSLSELEIKSRTDI